MKRRHATGGEAEGKELSDEREKESSNVKDGVEGLLHGDSF
jgi:hypothetical protein